MKTKRVFCDSLRRWGIGVVAAAMLAACSNGAADFGATARIRPVVTVTIAKE